MGSIKWKSVILSSGRRIGYRRCKSLLLDRGEEAERVNSQGVLQETADDYFLQNAGVNTINNVKSSSRPNNIAKLQTQI